MICILSNWRRTDENWTTFHAQYINMWNNRYEFLATREPIFTPKLAYYPEYMPWFRVHGKPYLLGEEARAKPPHARRPQCAPRNPKRGGHNKVDEVGPPSTLTQEPTSMVAPPLS
ncbi:hypothetical protein Goari_011376 [Gossypium aridum]|uniref:Aminotransferase-like plant mobile domain-containing protein n=1 Tax=Gossypium aridum TaxID=34290 RepID=A0A7J8WX38_GOSAI|nr:hypothetical protein [Gossypium aridum]